MISKGIILAGGTGSRLSPITKSVNKQLLPLYDKPMIFYPLSVLMLAKIRDILIITSKKDIGSFSNLFGDGKDLGIKINYLEQEKANGLPEAFIIGKKFIKNQNVALILGDNFFYGQGFTERLKKSKELKNGAKIFLYNVKNPKDYGTAIIKKNKIAKIQEKPKDSKSNLAITGLYFFDKNVTKYSKTLRPSKRSELEIVDLLNIYKKKNKLSFNLMGRGSAWLDTGSPGNLLSTSEFISTIENRQGLKVGCIEEIAFNYKWISKKNILKRIKYYGNSEYSNYLNKIVSNV
jgi:glucose-1-phosphate thymidylyltransferase